MFHAISFKHTPTSTPLLIECGSHVPMLHHTLETIKTGHSTKECRYNRIGYITQTLSFSLKKVDYTYNEDSYIFANGLPS